MSIHLSIKPIYSLNTVVEWNVNLLEWTEETHEDPCGIWPWALPIVWRSCMGFPGPTCPWNLNHCCKIRESSCEGQVWEHLPWSQPHLQPGYPRPCTIHFFKQPSNGYSEYRPLPCFCDKLTIRQGELLAHPTLKTLCRSFYKEEKWQQLLMLHIDADNKWVYSVPVTMVTFTATTVSFLVSGNLLLTQPKVSECPWRMAEWPPRL